MTLRGWASTTGRKALLVLFLRHRQIGFKGFDFQLIVISCANLRIILGIGKLHGKKC